LKIVGGDRFLKKLPFFAFLVCALQEPIELSAIDLLYLRMLENCSRRYSFNEEVVFSLHLPLATY